jgi:hypothetical protein
MALVVQFTATSADLGDQLQGLAGCICAGLRVVGERNPDISTLVPIGSDPKDPATVRVWQFSENEGRSAERLAQIARRVGIVIQTHIPNINLLCFAGPSEDSQKLVWQLPNPVCQEGQREVA